jgi:hypothetical protein
MVTAAELDGELVADLSTKRLGLGKALVMSVGRFAAADETWLSGDEFDVRAISHTAWLGERKPALVDRPDPLRRLAIDCAMGAVG